MVRVREDLGSLQEGGWAAPSQQREGSGAGGAEPWTAPAALCPWVCEGGRHLGQVGTVVQCFWRTHPEPLSPVGWGHFNLWGCARGGVHSLDNEDLGGTEGTGRRTQGPGGRGMADLHPGRHLGWQCRDPQHWCSRLGPQSHWLTLPPPPDAPPNQGQQDQDPERMFPFMGSVLVTPTPCEMDPHPMKCESCL